MEQLRALLLRPGALLPVERPGAPLPVERPGAPLPVERPGVELPVERALLERRRAALPEPLGAEPRRCV